MDAAATDSTHSSARSVADCLKSASTSSAFTVQNFPFELDDRLVLNYRKAEVNRRPYNSDFKEIFATYTKLCEQDRFFSTFSDCGITDPGANTATINIEQQPLNNQEQILMMDLIFVLQGIEGEYIRISQKEKGNKLALIIDPAFDSSLRTLIYRILPLAEDYHKVVNFCRNFNSYTNGLVVQAYCSALKILIEEYLTLVCQFECQLDSAAKNPLSIQKLYLYIQPVQKTMKLLSDFCEEIGMTCIVGGALLSFLNKKHSELMGDNSAVNLCRFLQNYCSKPYIAILERWLYTGEVDDPYEEFMIRENVDPTKKLLSGTAFDEIDNWEYRYYVKAELCPSNLASVADKILSCGKYLNIIFSCDAKSSVLQQFPVKRLTDIHNERIFLQQIEQVHMFASKALMHLLTDRFNLIRCFKSIKHYFLIDQGDWLLHFLELADLEELRSDLEDARLHRLESFLDIAFRSSLLSTDQLRDEIKITLKSTCLTGFLSRLLHIDQELADPLALKLTTKKGGSNLKAYDAVALKYDAPWPLSIIFNRKVMLQYEIIFRRLLQCKYVERVLSCCWMSKKCHNSPLYSLLLHQMMTFLKNYLYYATAEVIEPYWHKFQSNFLSESNGLSNQSLTIDDALKHHNLFLDDCTKDCLLTDGRLIESFQKILDICIRFAAKFDSSLNNFDDRDSTNVSVDELKRQFDDAQLSLLDRMQILSAASQERLWTDIACRLDLK